MYSKPKKWTEKLKNMFLEGEVIAYIADFVLDIIIRDYIY